MKSNLLGAAMALLVWLAVMVPSAVFSAEKIALSGITEPVVDVTLSFDQGGIVSAIHFKEGDAVKKGDVVIELQQEMEKLNVDLRKLLADSQVGMETAVEQERYLKSMLETTRELYEKTKSVSIDELKKLELDYILAEGKRREYEVNEQKEQMEYDIAMETLRKRTLTAPVSGIMIELLIEVGEVFEPRQPLMRLVDTTRCRFVTNIEEKIGRTLEKGQAVDLEIVTGTTTIRRKGIVAFVSPIVDSASNLIEVKVEFDNRDGKVRPGISGTMELSL